MVGNSHILNGNQYQYSHNLGRPQPHPPPEMYFSLILCYDEIALVTEAKESVKVEVQ